MHREPLTADRDRGRQRITETQPVGKRPKSVQPDMGDDLLAARFHHHRDGAVTVHLASALLVGSTVGFDNLSFPCQEGIFADARRSAQAAP